MSVHNFYQYLDKLSFFYPSCLQSLADIEDNTKQVNIIKNALAFG